MEEELKLCPWCYEIMTYGAYPQIGIKSIKKDGKYYTKSVNFIQYGWKCNYNTDDCDIIFEEKEEDKGKNKLNNNYADKIISDYFRMLNIDN